MPVLTLCEEVEEVLSNRLKNAYRTDELINAPDWVSDLASCLALAVAMADDNDLPRLTAFAHAELTRFIKEHRKERKSLYPDDFEGIEEAD